MRNVFYYFVITATFTCGCCMQGCSGEDFDEPWQDPEFETRAVRTRSGLEPPFTFPTASEIANSDAIISRMNAAWEQTLSSCTSSSRKEYGFYIYVDHSTGMLSGGWTYAGTEVNCNGSASLHMGNPTNMSTLCAMFHTHTSLEYCDTSHYRKTGPSSGDIKSADKKKIPGLLYDYTDSIIRGGQSKDSPKQIYIYGNYSQRPN